MKIIRIKRWKNYTSNLGVLTYGKFRCFTLELPDRDNAISVSSVLPGTYSAFLRDSPTNGPCVELRNVPGRTHIQIHAGSFLRNTKGCILVGSHPTFIDDDNIPDLTNSRKTLDKLLALLPTDEDFQVKIED